MRDESSICSRRTKQEQLTDSGAAVHDDSELVSRVAIDQKGI